MSSTDNTTRKGKIARLPAKIRNEVCLRLQANKEASEILPWLNELPEVKEVLVRLFDGLPINEQNLSNWRGGGFREWEDEQAEVERLQSLAEFSARLVASTGLAMSDGAAAIATGNILAQLETETDPAVIGPLIEQLTALRKGDHAVRDGKRKDLKLQLDQKKAQLKEREVLLAEEKFQRLLCEKIIDVAASPEVQRILQSNKPRSVKMEQLRLEIFGAPDEEGEEELSATEEEQHA